MNAFEKFGEMVFWNTEGLRDRGVNPFEHPTDYSHLLEGYEDATETHKPSGQDPEAGYFSIFADWLVAHSTTETIGKIARVINSVVVEPMPKSVYEEERIEEKIAKESRSFDDGRRHNYKYYVGVEQLA